MRTQLQNKQGQFIDEMLDYKRKIYRFRLMVTLVMANLTVQTSPLSYLFSSKLKVKELQCCWSALSICKLDSTSFGI